RTPSSVVQLNRSAPSGLVEVIDKALGKDLQQRYQTASDLRSDLQRCEISVPIRAITRSRQRRHWIVGVLVMIAIGVAGILSWLYLRGFTKARSEGPFIAVRELRNLSPQPDQSYFAAAMTQEIRGQLSKISALRMLSRAAVDKYRD